MVMTFQCLQQVPILRLMDLGLLPHQLMLATVTGRSRTTTGRTMKPPWMRRSWLQPRMASTFRFALHLLSMDDLHKAEGGAVQSVHCGDVDDPQQNPFGDKPDCL